MNDVQTETQTETEADEQESTLQASNTQTLVVDLEAIQVEEGFNPRQIFDVEKMLKLKAQIRSHGGLLHPLTVRDINETFYLSDGERRWKACHELLAEGYEAVRTVPVVVRSVNDADALIESLLANDGEALTAYEEAKAYERLVKSGWSQTRIGRELGKSTAHVNQILSLLEAEDDVQEALESGEISKADAKKIVRNAKKAKKGKTGGKSQQEALMAAKAEKKAPQKPQKSKRQEQLDEMRLVFAEDVGGKLFDYQPALQNKAKSKLFAMGYVLGMARVLGLEEGDLESLV
jgi:ParB family transcriptional regulator, chromosome partitioning protein